MAHVRSGPANEITVTRTERWTPKPCDALDTCAVTRLLARN
jgi:hypothetical protein